MQCALTAYFSPCPRSSGLVRKRANRIYMVAMQLKLATHNSQVRRAARQRQARRRYFRQHRPLTYIWLNIPLRRHQISLRISCYVSAALLTPVQMKRSSCFAAPPAPLRRSRQPLKVDDRFSNLSSDCKLSRSRRGASVPMDKASLLLSKRRGISNDTVHFKRRQGEAIAIHSKSEPLIWFH